jgi:hypothetical protein
MRNAYSILIRKPEGKRPFGRHRWRIILKFILKEIAWEAVNWIQLVQDRVLWRALVDTVLNLRAGKFLTR